MIDLRGEIGYPAGADFSRAGRLAGDDIKATEYDLRCALVTLDDWAWRVDLLRALYQQLHRTEAKTPWLDAALGSAIPPAAQRVAASYW